MVVFPFTIPGTVTLAYSRDPRHQVLKFKPSCSTTCWLSPLHLCMLACALSMSNRHSHNALSSSAFMLYWLGNQFRANLCMYLLSSCTGVQSHGILWRQLSRLNGTVVSIRTLSPFQCSLTALWLSLAPSGVPLPTLSRCMHALKLHCELHKGAHFSNPSPDLSVLHSSLCSCRLLLTNCSLHSHPLVFRTRLRCTFL